MWLILPVFPVQGADIILIKVWPKWEKQKSFWVFYKIYTKIRDRNVFGFFIKYIQDKG
jgi:hypothetical protein